MWPPRATIARPGPPDTGADGIAPGRRTGCPGRPRTARRSTNAASKPSSLASAGFVAASSSACSSASACPQRRVEIAVAPSRNRNRSRARGRSSSICAIAASPASHTACACVAAERSRPARSGACRSPSSGAPSCGPYRPARSDPARAAPPTFRRSPADTRRQAGDAAADDDDIDVARRVRASERSAATAESVQYGKVPACRDAERRAMTTRNEANARPRWTRGMPHYDGASPSGFNERDAGRRSDLLSDAPWHIEADVAIVGGGITGALSPRRLRGAGIRVAVLERGARRAWQHGRQLRAAAAGARPGPGPAHRALRRGRQSAHLATRPGCGARSRRTIATRSALPATLSAATRSTTRGPPSGARLAPRVRAQPSRRLRR